MDELNKLTISNSGVIQKATPEMGKALHDEALQRENKRRQDLVIVELQRLESTRIDYARKADFAVAASNWYAGKLKAVENGEFSWDTSSGSMIFNNPDFNRANY